MADEDKPVVPPDPVAEAALLLIESLIHEFVARQVLDQRQAAEIVTTALEAQLALCDDRREDSGANPSVAALMRIRSSFAIDGYAPVVDGFELKHRDGSSPS